MKQEEEWRGCAGGLKFVVEVGDRSVESGEDNTACREDGVAAHVRALHRSGEERRERAVCVAANGRCAPGTDRCSPAARLPAHLSLFLSLSPLTQGSPLCGSRMCPWLRCVDLLAVAACSTPRFHSERAKSPAWTFLPPPLPFFPPPHPPYARQTLHSLGRFPPLLLLLLVRFVFYAVLAIPIYRVLSRWLIHFHRLDGNGWKPRGNLTFRGNAREAVSPRQTVAFPRQ